VTPNVSVTVPGLHPFNKLNLDDQSQAIEQANVLRGWGDRSCLAGLPR
jgi:hypothetical protein